MPQAWQVPNPDPAYWQGLPELHTIDTQASQLVLPQVSLVAQDLPVLSDVYDGAVVVPTLVDPQTTTISHPTRPCKRKARQKDSEIWPRPTKKAKCPYEDPHAFCHDARPTSSPFPVSPTPALPSSSTLSSSSLLPSPTATSSSIKDLSELEPIVIPPPSALHCPMPGCGVHLPHRDSAWRTHFRVLHHVDFCADARAGSCTGNCKYPCPLPQGHSAKCAKAMEVESIGRHLMNIHFGVRHRCPVCGREKAQRYWSCQRHIPVCLAQKAAKKEGETSTKERATPAKKERKKPTKKPRGRTAQRRQ
ncbi:hypothetical protein GY45DRAFT_1109729 [Cubamyces sp. BRFM 1775]|nr:hypothetical protein GY45DRAFT_1109729 [Cubamyces sp. BRFM 1775]